MDFAKLFACIRYKDDKKKDVYLPITKIKSHYSSKDHIRPKNLEDFDKSHTYYMYWCSCKGDECSSSPICDFYKGYVVCLGDSIDSIKEKMSTSGRIILPRSNVIESTDSESSDDTSKQPERKKQKMIKAAVAAENKQNILQQYKQKCLLKGSKEICFNEESDNENCQECKILKEEITNLNSLIKTKDKKIAELMQLCDNLRNNEDADNGLAVPLNDDECHHETNEVNEDNEEFKLIKLYKPRLFKYYANKRKASADTRPLRETSNRYDVVNDQIYLGLGISAGRVSWEMTRKKKDKFIRDVALILWGKHALANRCLDLSKVANYIPGRSPMKLCSPRKLNLFLGIVEDYIKEKISFSHLNDDQKFVVIQSSTEVLTALIRDLRREACKDY